MVVPKIRDNNESSNSSSRMKQKSMTIRISSWCCSNYRKRGGATSCHIFIGIAGIWLFGIIVVCLTLLSNNTNKSDKSFIRGANSSANMGDAIRRAGNGMNNDVVANGSQGHQQKGRRKPSKPLCDECLQIVQSAEAIDISYVDVKTDAMGQHPHMGARDEYGNTNDYIHNETALRFNPPKLNYDSLMAGCTNRDNNYRMLHDKVFVDIEYDTSMQTKQQKRPKLFCLIYTIESNHDKVHNIRETWGYVF